MCQYCSHEDYKNEKAERQDFEKKQKAKKKRTKKQATFVLKAYDDDFPSRLFAGWLTVKKFKARHINHAKTLGRKFAKQLRLKVWRVRKKQK